MSKQQLIDRNGDPIIIGDELGKGGEGTVFNIQGKSNIVAKIYHKSLDIEKSYKIINMVEAGNERLLKLAAWPINSVHVRSGDLIGFIMQKLQGYRPLFELYSPKLRLQEFPHADWRFLIHAATNTARAFSIVHDAGHVIGDVNHGNLLVANDATVKFIDTDSFQIAAKGQYWLCEVGAGTHQPPEMQGRTTYRGIIRNFNHDNFGLAVLIFQLLCLARHPFSGRFLGQGDMPIEKAIAEYRFAYTRDNRLTQMAPPPASLAMTALTPRIWSFFERAFTKGAKENTRPSPKEWISALEELAASLKTCKTNLAHHYFNSLSICPWCDIEMKSNTIIFPVVVQFPNSIQNFQVLWQKALSIKNPGPAPSMPKIASTSVPPSKEAQEIGKKAKRLEKQSYALLAMGGIAFITCIFFGCNLWQLILTGIGVGGFIYKKEAKSTLICNELKQLNTAKARWTEISSNWANWVSDSAFIKAKCALDEIKKKYDALQQDRQYQTQKLWDNRRKQQMLAHLDRYRIHKANIDGIGPSRSVTLQSYGIETAADVDPRRIDGISGFGPKLIQRLIDWRYRCERAFVFDPAKGVLETELQGVDRYIVLPPERHPKS